MRKIIVILENVISLPKRIFSHVAIFVILQEAVIDKTAAICNGVKFYRGRIGKYSYIGNNSFVTDTDIGNYTSISTDCYIGGSAHPTDWVSTSPVFHKWENIMKKNFAQHEFEIFNRTTIGNDVWVGNRVMVKSGVNIANGAVVGMGSVVTKDIGPYEVWAGNPARFIRKRFDDKTINKVESMEWWNWSDEKVASQATHFNSLDNFLKNSEVQ